MVTTAVAPAPGDQEPAKIGAVGRITGVLFSPGATYEDIVRKPSWFVPLLLLTLLSIVTCYFLIPKVDWAAFQRKQLESSPFTRNLTDEQKEQSIERSVKISVPITWAVGAVGPAIGALLITLFYWAGFNVFKGAKLGFGKSFAITCYAFVPSIISTILTIIIVILKRPGEVDPQRLAATSLGAFLAGDAPKWLVALGSSLDLFWFWTMALLAIGYAAANPKKISTGSAFAVVVGMWVVWVLVKVGFAAAF
jgi:hypothetical protein